MDQKIPERDQGFVVLEQVNIQAAHILIRKRMNQDDIRYQAMYAISNQARSPVAFKVRNEVNNQVVIDPVLFGLARGRSLVWLKARRS